METFIYITIFTLIGSVVSLIGGILLLLKKGPIQNIAHYLGSFAAGALLATAFFDLLPEAIDLSEDVSGVFIWTLIGIIFFFLFERAIHWFHHHQHDHDQALRKPIIPLIIVGDSVHNFIDGLAIGSTFVLNIPLGIVTALAVGAHEIPQEIGDFGVLLKEGMARKKVLLVNILSALTAFMGAFGAYFLGKQVEGILYIFLSLTAGFFIYVALSDLVPEIHHENRKGFAVKETACLLLGVFSIYLTLYVIENIFHIQP